MIAGGMHGNNGRRWLLRLALLLCVLSAWQFATAGYIHAKAELAQWLIADAWQRTPGRAPGKTLALGRHLAGGPPESGTIKY